MLRIVVQNGAVCGCFNSQQILLKELLLRGDLNFFVLSAIPNLKRDESYKYNTHKIDRHRMLQSITGSKCDSRTKSKQSEKKKKKLGARILFRKPGARLCRLQESKIESAFVFICVHSHEGNSTCTTGSREILGGGNNRIIMQSEKPPRKSLIF